ncbi:hypothetical protein BC830DRAFT_738053 [Chytriomyces sp. MP71]|nr:hypothetical protein BC830DRAFT_738053 [Chytriomyces sp. MP71]
MAWKRGHILTVERAREIWHPMIERQKSCEECGHAVIERQMGVIFKHRHSVLMPQKVMMSRNFKCFAKDVKSLLFMENYVSYQARIRNAIRAAPVPVTIRPDSLDDVMSLCLPEQLAIALTMYVTFKIGLSLLFRMSRKRSTRLVNNFNGLPAY